jgi:hypothetical protein
MRTFSIFCVIVLLSAKAFAQQQRRDDRTFYIAKMEHYRKMNNTGSTLAILGSALLVVGMVTELNSPDDNYNNGFNSNSTASAGNPIAGTMCFLGGMGCLGVGVPLWIVGGINKRRYERKAEAVSFKIKVNQQSAGITLCYKF